MTAPTRPTTDADFEAELRAMLERRAADVGAPRPAARRVMAGPIDRRPHRDASRSVGLRESGRST